LNLLLSPTLIKKVLVSPVPLRFNLIEPVAHLIDTRERLRNVNHLRLFARSRGCGYTYNSQTERSAGKVGRRRFELRLRPPEGRRIPGYPTGPQSEKGQSGS